MHATDAYVQRYISSNPNLMILDLVHPVDYERAKIAFHSVADGFALEQHLRVRTSTPNNEVRLFEVMLTAPREYLQADGIIVTYTDVTVSATAEALRSISRRLALSPLDDTNNAIEHACADTLIATGLDSTTLFTADESGTCFHIVRTTRIMELVGDSPYTTLTLEMPAVARAIATRSAVVLTPGDDDVTWKGIFIEELPPLYVLIIVPLFAADQLEAIAIFGSNQPNWRVTPHTIGFLETVNELMAGAFARLRTSKELENRALLDPLTHLPNRRMLTERLDQVVSRIRRSKTWVALIVIDCDGFKDINDTFGHPVGDRVLVAVAERLESVCRSGELVARFGGDEFVVMVESEAPETTVVALSERIVEALDTTYEIQEGTHAYLSASVGVAVHRGDSEAVDAATMFKRADLAMYRAKQAGRNRFILFAEEMETETRDRFELTADLRSALRNQDELSLWYQPVVHLESGDLAGYEALIRWEHPKRGTLLPASFIELAEESGDIVELGWILMAMALRQMREWRSGGVVGPYATIAVNLSVRQLMATDFQRTIESIIRESQLPPHLLELELTESVFAEVATVAPRLQQLRDLGVKVSIDDFGTGYSSLAYLRDLPVDIVKMDKSFIRRLGSDRRDAALVSALIKVAHELGLMTIAEGVEIPEQAAYLKELNCDRAQGFLFGRPQPRAVSWPIQQPVK